MTDFTTRPLYVFLCHASGDKPTVREIYRQLDAEGWIDVWLDEIKLLPGQEWDIEIEKAVEQADIVLVCLSTRSVDKEGYVQKELRFVLNIADEKPEGSIFVIPLRLEDCAIPRRLRNWQRVDFFPNDQRNLAYQRLLESLSLRAQKLGLLSGKHDSKPTVLPFSQFPANEPILIKRTGEENRKEKEFETSRAALPHKESEQEENIFRSNQTKKKTNVKTSASSRRPHREEKVRPAKKSQSASRHKSDQEEQIIWGKFAIDVLQTLVLAILLFVGINTISVRSRVTGPSMVPSLHDGEYVLVSKLSYIMGLPARGDIVVFRFPTDPTEIRISRIIGLPGDLVIIQDGEVNVNGIALEESYIAESPSYDGEWKVPENQYFVLGDNRNNSSDSHIEGTLFLENIIGKAVLVYWPLSNIRAVNKADQSHTFGVADTLMKLISTLSPLTSSSILPFPLSPYGTNSLPSTHSGRNTALSGDWPVAARGPGRRQHVPC